MEANPCHPCRHGIELEIVKASTTPAAAAGALRLEEAIAGRAKERQQGGQGGILLCQKSDEAIDTKREIAKAAGVSHDTVAKVPLLERRREILAGQAKERQVRKPADSVVGNSPPQTDKTRDAIAAEIGVSNTPAGNP